MQNHNRLTYGKLYYWKTQCIRRRWTFRKVWCKLSDVSKWYQLVHWQFQTFRKGFKRFGKWEGTLSSNAYTSSKCIVTACNIDDLEAADVGQKDKICSETFLIIGIAHSLREWRGLKNNSYLLYSEIGWIKHSRWAVTSSQAGTGSLNPWCFNCHLTTFVKLFTCR